MNTATIVQKLWNYCNVLRDNGMSYVHTLGSSIYFLKGQRPRFTTVAGTGRKAQKQEPVSAFSRRNGFLCLLRFSSIY